MNEPDTIERTDTVVGEPTPSRPTKRDLVERGLDALRAEEMHAPAITLGGGGLTFSNMLEVMDFAKAMSTGGKVLPPYLRGNPGGCLAITFQAIHWRMDPFQVANKSYEVNDRIGYESQLIHAVIESRAPLQHRLDCEYRGEGPERMCIVRGLFTSGDVRDYESPPLRKVKKKSPLWDEDPDQQLFYYASRSWARKWCPDVLLGIYAREELAENPSLGREVSEPGLHARLIGSPRAGDEGHRDGHAAAELDQLAANGMPPKANTEAAGASADPEDGIVTVSTGKQTKPSRGKGKKPGRKALPTSVSEYVDWAREWIAECDNQDDLYDRWKAERDLRNKLGMTADDRNVIDQILVQRAEELEGQ